MNAAVPPIDPTKFVVHLHEDYDLDQVRERLAAIGSVEPVEGDPHRVLLATAGKSPVDAKVAWERVRESLGGKADVDPVFLDESGSPRLPTGKVMVRFESPPSEAELSEYERRCGLHVEGRNKYVPSQVVFSKAADGRYLPDLIEELAGTVRNARAVWADMLSRYRRV